MEQLHDYFSNPTPNQFDAKDAYQVCQGNLHVTMAWVRFVLVGYREELLNLSGPPGTPSRTGACTRALACRAQTLTGTCVTPTAAAERMSLNLEGSNDSREVIAVDLLNTLHSIPMQSLAVNGPSLVQKTRFVAAMFLETPATESDDARARISAYLFDFLTVLSEIEKVRPRLRRQVRRGAALTELTLPSHSELCRVSARHDSPLDGPKRTSLP